MSELRFTVLGRPQPGGSKRAFAVRKDGVPTGRIAVADANPKAKSWQREVKLAAMAALEANGWQLLPNLGPDGLLTGPLNVSMTFYVSRPKGHHRAGRLAHLLKDSAPPLPIVRPDCSKLLRAAEDALTGLVYRDDAQIVDLDVHKRYGTPERCEVVVRYTPAVGEDVAA